MEADYAAFVNDETVWVAEDGDQLLGFIVLIDASDPLLLRTSVATTASINRGQTAPSRLPLASACQVPRVLAGSTLICPP